MLGCRELEVGTPATRGGLQAPAGPGPRLPVPSPPAAAGRSMARQSRRCREEAAVGRGTAPRRSCRALPVVRAVACWLRRPPPLAVTWRPRVTHKAAREAGVGRFGGCCWGRAASGSGWPWVPHPPKHTWVPTQRARTGGRGLRACATWTRPKPLGVDIYKEMRQNVLSSGNY